MKSRACVLVCLFAVAIAVAFPISAQGPLIGVEAEGVLEIGGWLANWLAGYSLGKTVDQLFTNDKEAKLREAKLREMENRLQKQLNQGTADRKQVEAVLAVAQQELQILQRLMAGRPSRKQIEKDQAALASDLNTIRATVAEHERRLAEHDRALAEQGKIIESQGRELDGLKQRIDQLQPLSPRLPPGREPAFPGNYGSTTGTTLTIQVRGKDNFIRLREATHPVLMGTFSFSRSGANAAYFLPRQARAIVELFGPNNRISMSAQIAQQVQILSHGFYYQKLVY